MKLVQVSSAEMITFLESKGFINHHSKGSHFVLIKQGICRVVVLFRKQLPVGTTLAILREAGLSREDYLNFFARK